MILPVLNSNAIEEIKMARGGYRPGAGRPRKEAGKAPIIRDEEHARKPQKSLGGKSPLEYMLDVMNDDAAEDARRDKMAMAAAPYVHLKADEAKIGKKEERQQAAEKVAAGKFAPRSGPRLAVNNS